MLPFDRASLRLAAGFIVVLFALSISAEAARATNSARRSRVQLSKPILACTRWNATGIHVQAGVTYRFEFYPSPDLADAVIRVQTLDGWPPSPQRAVLTPLLGLFRRRPFDPWFSLIGTVEHGEPFRVTSAQWTPRRSGALFCYFNDLPIMYWNNHGSARLAAIALPLHP